MSAQRQNTDKKVFSILSITVGSILVIGDLLALLSLIPNSCQGVASDCGTALMFKGMMTGGYIYVVTPFLFVLTMIFGIVGIIKKENRDSHRLAIVGLGLGIIGEIIAILFIVFSSWFRG